MIKYITIKTLQNQGGHIQEYPIQICSISDGSRHGVKYICIWKYLNTVLGIWCLGIKSICI